VLRAEGLLETELKRAKAKVVGQKKIARQDLGGYAMTTALDELYGLGYANSDSENEYYEAVTLEKVREVAQKHLRPEVCVVTILKPGTDVVEAG
jgi:predicted Zn-dependent peptidase